MIDGNMGTKKLYFLAGVQKNRGIESGLEKP